MYDNLIDLRKSLGLDQKEFAESVGYKRTTYANYESGVRAPSSDFWIAVSKKTRGIHRLPHGCFIRAMSI